MTRTVRESVYNKYGGRCAYCGNSIEYKNMQVDHYLPQCRERFYSRRFKKEVHAEVNLMPACRRCNHYKRARTPKQFRELIATLHERIASIYIMKVAIDFGITEVKPFDGKFYFERMEEREPILGFCTIWIVMVKQLSAHSFLSGVFRVIWTN